MVIPTLLFLACITIGYMLYHFIDNVRNEERNEERFYFEILQNWKEGDIIELYYDAERGENLKYISYHRNYIFLNIDSEKNIYFKGEYNHQKDIYILNIKTISKLLKINRSLRNRKVEERLNEAKEENLIKEFNQSEEQILEKSRELLK